MSKQNIALITGVTGQDGSYLAELLLDKGYDVHGVIRRSSVDYRERIAHLEGRLHFHLHYADLGDSMSIVGVVADVRPTEIYNLAAQSHVQVSFDSPEFTADVDAVGVLRIIEAVRKVGLASSCKIYQASTSELYGKVEEVPQNENTPFHPFSPYAVAKQYGFWIIKEYRDAYGMFCCNGILFNHESERRGETFVTRKITLAAARIAQGLQDKLYLGNLDSLRDWGYAKDYVECMWLILQARQPEDFVIATGVQHSVREFAQLAFHYVGIELQWEGEAEHEKGICVSGPDHLVGKTLVEVSPDFYRPTDVVNLWGDPRTATRRLNIAQSFNPVGSILGILMSKYFILDDISLYSISGTYAALGLVLLGILVVMLFARMPSGKDDDRSDSVGASFRRLLSNRLYRRGVVAQFFYVGAQIGVWSFTIRLVMQETGRLEAAASSIYLISIIGHCLSRFIYTGLMRWFSPSRLLTFGGVMSALLSLTVVLSAGTGWLCITSLVLISSFMSLMFPTIYGIALGGIMRGDHPGDSKIGASGLIMSILGGALLTPLQGMVSDHTNIYTSYAVPAFCFVVVTAYAVYAHRCKATL